MTNEKELTIEVVQKKVNGMQTMLDAYPVSNDAELAGVSDKIKDIKTLCKAITAQKEKFTLPAKEIIANANEKFDPYIKACKNAEEVLKLRAVKYHNEQEAKRIADEKKLADKVDSGYMKSETAVKKMEAMPEVQKTVTTQSSGLRFTKRKVAVIFDLSLIPKEYWVVDEVKVRKEALAGVMIPGVKVEEQTSSASV